MVPAAVQVPLSMLHPGWADYQAIGATRFRPVTDLPGTRLISTFTVSASLEASVATTSRLPPEVHSECGDHSARESG
jgi:hypothetical protein